MALRPTEKSVKRYKVMRIAAIVCFLGLAVQLFVIQIVNHDKYEQMAVDQQTSDITIEAARGPIVDRNGNVLAISATAYKVIMAPAVIKSDEVRKELSEGLAQILDLEYEEVYEKASQNSQYVIIARRIDKEVADKVSEFIVSDPDYSAVVTLTEDTKRYYPNGNLLSTVLGFVGTDNQGLEGLEYSYDEYLKGSDGKQVAIKTSVGTVMPFAYEKVIEPEDGATLQLTIDLEIQSLLEKHIENARVEHNVQNRIAGIVYDIKTGEVLGMTSKPDYDPNNPFVINDELTLEALSAYSGQEYIDKYNEYLATFRTNKAIEQYEPGSTFKIITAAMALEEGVVDLAETFNCVGYLKIGSIMVRCAKRQGHGVETFKDGLANSCNPVFMTLAERIGPEKFYDYITIFGFREKTNVGLPGEQSGYHYAKGTMTALNLANSSFGQSFKITGMQLVAAVSSVANDGKYMQPYIIKSITDSDGKVIMQNSPTVVRQTVSESTSDILCEYLEYTVAKSATSFLAGYRMAGKTGTSQKLDTLANNGEDNGKRIASFICFAPADDPQVCILVVVDEPDSEVQYGSYIAAPLGRDIMADVLDYLGVEPDYGDGESVKDVTVPDVEDMDYIDAQTELGKLNIRTTVIGTGDTVVYQLPAKGTVVPEGSDVILYTEQGYEEDTQTVVPNLVGKPASECNLLLVDSNLNIKVVGSNLSYSNVVAVSQSIEPGTTVSKGTVVTVTFEKTDSPLQDLQ